MDNTITYIDRQRDVEIVFDKKTREIISWSMPYWEDNEIEEEFAYARLAVFGQESNSVSVGQLTVSYLVFAKKLFEKKSKNFEKKVLTNKRKYDIIYNVARGLQAAVENGTGNITQHRLSEGSTKC